MTLSIQNLTKVYATKGKQTHCALNGISLEVGKGEIFGIIGKSGAGKSTLMRCLAYLERPTSGTISIDHQELFSLGGQELSDARKMLGMVFQHYNLFNAKTAWENVAFPLEISKVSFEKRRSRAYELLELVGLRGKETAYPLQLSGGEKQRVAIARALANHPKVLLVDEGTSALDPGNTKAILDVLLKLNRELGITIFLITHQMEVIKHICSKVAVLEKGEIVESGLVGDLFTAPKHPLTKHFLYTLSHDLPEDFMTIKGSRLLHLSFKGESAKQPIISKMIKQFAVDVNILLGGIDRLQNVTIGNLVIELTGSVDDMEKAYRFLKEQGVICEEVYR